MNKLLFTSIDFTGYKFKLALSDQLSLMEKDHFPTNKNVWNTAAAVPHFCMQCLASILTISASKSCNAPWPDLALSGFESTAEILDALLSFSNQLSELTSSLSHTARKGDACIYIRYVASLFA